MEKCQLVNNKDFAITKHPDDGWLTKFELWWFHRYMESFKLWKWTTCHL